MPVDFLEIRELLKEGVRTTLTTLREQHPDEHFYAFALYDAEGENVAPSANSEEKYQARIARQKCADSDSRFMYRWGTAEWAYEALEYGPFEEARELLSQAPKDEWLEFQVQSYGASIFALKELAAEGFFGTGEFQITAYFSLSDDDPAAWLERESARRINPPAVFAKFEPEWQIAMLQIWGDSEIDGGDFEHAFPQILGSAW